MANQSVEQAMQTVKDLAGRRGGYSRGGLRRAGEAFEQAGLTGREGRDYYFALLEKQEAGTQRVAGLKSAKQETGLSTQEIIQLSKMDPKQQQFYLDLKQGTLQSTPTDFSTMQSIPDYSKFRSDPNFSKYQSIPTDFSKFQSTPSQQSQFQQQLNKFIQDVTKGQPTGTRIEQIPIYNERGNITGYESALVPVYQTAQERAIQRFKLRYLGENYQKVLPWRRRLLNEGQKFYPEEFVLGLALTGGVAGVAGLSSAAGLSTIPSIPSKIKYGGAVLFSEPITKISNLLYEAVPTPSTTTGKFVKGATGGYVFTKVLPTTGLAQATELFKGLLIKPSETVTGVKEGFIQAPAESTGMIVGGYLGLGGRGESLIRRAIGQEQYKIETINVPNYGEVKFIDTTKYGKIAFVEGKFAQSEKLALSKQIGNSLNVDRVVFTQASPSGIPLSKQGKGSGFEVIETTKPLRGFYEAPPLDFLKAVKNTSGSGILTYYLQATRRRELSFNPIKGYIDLLTGKGTLEQGRPSVALRRGKFPKQESWVYETGISLESGGGIPSKYSTIINKYYNDFLKKGVTWNGKAYVGKEAVDLLNNINLRGRGSGINLKVYIALIEYQRQTGRGLIGGAEVISNVIPFGLESQLVQALGTKYYRRSAKDLRKAKPYSLVENIVSKVTGKQRGQAFARINGELLEFEYFRTYPKGGGKKARQPIKPLSKEAENKINEVLINRRREPTRRYNLGLSSTINLLTSSKKEAVRRTERRTIINDLIVRRPQPTRRRATTIRRFDIPIVRTTQTRREPTRRFNDVIVQRRPEIRRTTPKPIIRRREIQRPRENIINTILRKPQAGRRQQQRKLKISKTKVTGRIFSLTPTITQTTRGIRRNKPLPLTKLTGFESITI